jgi:small-conductance mechanosensitive channel
MSKDLIYYIYILSATLLGGIFGFLLERFLLQRTDSLIHRTNWKIESVPIGSFRGLFILISISTSSIIAVNYYPVSQFIRDGSNKFAMMLLILALTILAIRLSVKFVGLKTRDVSGKMPSTSIILNIIRISILLIGLMLILQVFGVSITPLLTALGVGGLAVVLALQETLSNLFSGIQLIASKKIRNGDYIRLNTGEEGYVTDIAWRDTVIRALANNLIIVPNSKLSSSIITNYNLPDKELAVLIEVSVSFDSDLDQVEKVTNEAAKETLKLVQGGVSDFLPFIRYHSFSQFGISFSVILRGLKFEDQYLIKHEFIKALVRKYKEHFIEIPFPFKSPPIKMAAENNTTLKSQNL